MWALLALAAAALESGAMIVEKKALIKEHAMEFCAAMSLFALLFTTPLWFFSGAKALELNAVGMIFAASITTSFTILLFAKALRHLAISYAAPFLAFGPLLTAILAFAFLGERISSFQGLGIVVLIIGAYILNSQHDKDLFEPFRRLAKLKSMKFVWLGLAFYATTGLLDKKIVGQEQMAVPVLAYLCLLFFFMSVIFIVMMLLFHNGFSGIGNGLKNNTKWLSLVALFTVGFKVAVMFALATPGALLSLVIPIKKLSSIFSTVIGGELFHEKDVMRKAMACMIMITGAVLILV